MTFSVFISYSSSSNITIYGKVQKVSVSQTLAEPSYIKSSWRYSSITQVNAYLLEVFFKLFSSSDNLD